MAKTFSLQQQPKIQSISEMSKTYMKKITRVY